MQPSYDAGLAVRRKTGGRQENGHSGDGPSIRTIGYVAVDQTQESDRLRPAGAMRV